MKISRPMPMRMTPPRTEALPESLVPNFLPMARPASQMKKVTKRLTSTYFMARYRHFLQDGGLIHLKTDSNFLFTYTNYMVNENHLPVLFRTDDLYHTLEAEQDEEVKQILGIQTYYEQQWIARGLTIKYLKYQLPQQGELVEPNVEIELDDYRSYNRSKRSGLTTSK